MESFDYEKAIELEELRSKFGKGKGINIAVLDTGLDLKWNIPTKFAMNMQDKASSIQDESGHGTMVAGLIYNIAPEANLHVFKVLDKNGHGTVGNIMDGITGAMNLNCDIICLSLGGAGVMPEVFYGKLDEARNRKITLIAPVGNSGKLGIEYPAKREDVWAIGGIDENFKRAEFSNFGKELDFVAPSKNIQSSHLNGKFAIDSGTSFGAPIIAGMLACVMSYYGNDKSIDYKDIFIRGSKNLGNSTDYSHGLPIGSLLTKAVEQT